MKKSLKNISRLLLITGCMSVLVSNIVVAAPQTYDMGTSDIRSNYALPNRIKLTGDVNFDDHGQTITLSLRNTDVQQVLRMFADKAGLNIVFNDSAKGNVTLDLVDVTLEDAFKLVMKMCDLTYVIKDKTMLVVGTADAEKLNLTKDNITILPVKYIDAAYIANFLNSNVFSLNTPGLSYGPIVTTNADKNELLIFGTENDYILAKKIVDRFDRKPSMTTYRVNHTTPFEMAKMICETLFQLPVTSSSGGSGGNAKSELTANFKMQTSATQAPEGALGGGTIACSMASSVKTGNLSSFQAKPSISIYVQPELGTLTMVGGSAQQVEMVNEFILENDRKQPQAYLEVQFIVLDEQGQRAFNNAWQYHGKHIDVGFGGIDGKTTVSDLYWHGNINKNQRHTLVQTISYIITNTKSKTLANPKIVITNGKKSTIDLSQDYIKTTTSQYMQNAGGSGAAVAQKSVEIGNDQGIKVEVLPFISPDGYVSLTIKPDYVSPAGPPQLDPATGDILATLMARHNLQLNNVRIKDEETLVIGGMIIEEVKNSTGKIPLLGDIPVLGFLFRSENKTNSKNELLIILTPRIIKDTEDVVDQV